MLILLVVLQAVQVAFLWLHDWIPLGVLNDVAAVRKADSMPRLIKITFIQGVPWTIGLFFTLRHLTTPFPDWLWWWLWISYGLLFFGELRAWWVPYWLRPEPQRAERYRLMFGNTHAFLPERNGIRPNTLHILLHACTAATLVLLAQLTL
jgi:hypothetical protein